MAKVSIPPVGFLGAGKMATALARGWIKAKLLTPEHIVASDPVPAKGVASPSATVFGWIWYAIPTRGWKLP